MNQILILNSVISPFHSLSALHTGQVTIDALEDSGRGLHGLIAHGALWTRHHLGLGGELGQEPSQILLLLPEVFQI